MASERFSAESIARLLRRQQVATMDELKDALGSRVDMTVFRKMRRLPYLSSYSHGGRDYTLREGAGVDEGGVWRGGCVDLPQRALLAVWIARRHGGDIRESGGPRICGL